jgi:hypothetical protein
MVHQYLAERGSAKQTRSGKANGQLRLRISREFESPPRFRRNTSGGARLGFSCLRLPIGFLLTDGGLTNCFFVVKYECACR